MTEHGTHKDLISQVNAGIFSKTGTTKKREAEGAPLGTTDQADNWTVN